MARKNIRFVPTGEVAAVMETLLDPQIMIAPFPALRGWIVTVEEDRLEATLKQLSGLGAAELDETDVAEPPKKRQSMIHELTGNISDLEALLTEWGNPGVVYLWAPWAGPCQMMAPVIDELPVKFPSDLLVVKVNVDEHRDITSWYGCLSIPMTILVKGGISVDTLIGAAPAERIHTAITRTLDLEMTS